MFEKYVFENLVPRYFSKDLYSQPHSWKQFSTSRETLLTYSSNLILQNFYFVKFSPPNLNEGLIHNVMRAIYFKARGNLFWYLYFD